VGLYSLALALTLAVEAPVVRAGYRAVPRARLWATFLCVNAFTHGLLWTVWPLLPLAYAPRVAVAELAVWLVEAGLYAALLGAGAARALVVSLAANALSTGAALLLWRALLAK
jgi:hypothetical protein